MIKRESRDYQIAILGSLVFHLLLFLIYFPNGLLQREMNLKTYPVGIVTLPKGSGGITSETPIIEAQVIGENPPQPVTKPEHQSIPQEPLKKVPETPKTNLPAQSIASAETPQSEEKPPTTAPENNGGTTGPVGEGAGSGDAGTGGSPKPRGLGNGEGRVFQMGALPPYPKNPMNEGIQGTVGLRILIFDNGEVEKVELVNSSGDSRLDNAALRAVNNWQFQPESIAYYIDIVFAFDLKNGVSVKFIKAETRP